MKYNSENKELWTQYYKYRYNLEPESSLLGERAWCREWYRCSLYEA